MHTMTFLQKLYAKDLVRTDLILISDVSAKVSDVHSMKRLWGSYQHWNMGSAGFSPFCADDVYSSLIS